MLRYLVRVYLHAGAFSLFTSAWWPVNELQPAPGQVELGKRREVPDPVRQQHQRAAAGQTKRGEPREVPYAVRQRGQRDAAVLVERDERWQVACRDEDALRENAALPARMTSMETRKSSAPASRVWISVWHTARSSAPKAARFSNVATDSGVPWRVAGCGPGAALGHLRHGVGLLDLLELLRGLGATRPQHGDRAVVHHGDGVNDARAAF